MGHRNKSQPSTAAKLTLGQGHMASRQDDLLVKISEMEKSLAKISEMENSPGKVSEMEKSLGQLFDWTKSITEELRLLRPIPPVTTSIPISTVIDGSPNHENVNVCPSLHVDSEDASMTVNQGEARSVYLLVSSYGSEYANAIYEVKFKHGVGVTHEPPLVGLVAKFHEGLCFQAARNFNRSKLYCLVQKGGYIIDTKTKSICSSISPTLAPKSIATVVCAYDKIYCVASPSGFLPIPEPSFERYDPNQDIWEKMPSFPFYNDYDTCMDITGYAVCYGVILFSLCGMKENSFDVVAFHESRNRWNRVKVDTSIHHAPFDGRAVVVGKTIYALHGEEFIAFSFKMDKDDDCDITYSLRKLFILRGLKIASPPWPFCDYQTEYLVHLGNRDFFHVKTGYCDISLGVQYLCITTFQIVVGNKGKDRIKTINSTVRSVEIKKPYWFGLVFCFTPEYGDYEPTLDELESTLDENSFLVEGKRRTMTKKVESKKGITTRKLEIPARLHEIGNDGGISISKFQIGTPNIQIQKPWMATT
ncbi:PREDICTED: uncharacterized protein LOC103342209 [Prunus mume]|uniref:Uncharacterized protein LOC103342209 n=1 Tax=Prunus mume TaxID=102107 RepID=A0ABM0PT17_PRUMU|nr:PREDICTED: uncharacterized protein LOC103342209 [Prunus mume]XP_016652198.1 PREDICTED: uncharacterized protein LOC103342209 [Prunus mume]